MSTTSLAAEVEGMIFERLIDLDNETLEYIPKLATRWEISKDKLTYTFYLRNDVRWHDGAPFTSDDVVYSFERIMDPTVDAAVQRQSLIDVKKIEALGPYKVRFTYKRPYFRALLVCGLMPIVPRHLYENGMDFNSHPLNRAPVGTGPFVFEKWETHRKIVLKANPNYWGKRPGLAGIIYKIISDNTVAFQELKKGELDMAELSPIQWKYQSSGDKFKEVFLKHRYTLPQCSFIGWNLERPYFKDARVRKAMALLVDRKKIAEKLHFGEVLLISGDQYIFGPAYDQDIQPLPYDPEMGVKLLDEAGWVDHDGDGLRDKDGVPFKFTLITAPGPGRTTSIIREDLLKSGIEMDVRQLEFNTMIRMLNVRDFDAAMLGWMGFIENDPYQLWHSSQAMEGSNFVGFKNAEADRVIEAIRLEFDPAKRRRLFHQLHRIIHEEQPYMFLFTPYTLLARHNRFTNVNVYKLGVDVKEWEIEESSKSKAQTSNIKINPKSQFQNPEYTLSWDFEF